MRERESEREQTKRQDIEREEREGEEREREEKERGERARESLKFPKSECCTIEVLCYRCTFYSLC